MKRLSKSTATRVGALAAVPAVTAILWFGGTALGECLGAERASICWNSQGVDVQTAHERLVRAGFDLVALDNAIVRGVRRETFGRLILLEPMVCCLQEDGHLVTRAYGFELNHNYPGQEGCPF